MFLFTVGFVSLLYLSLTAQPTSTVVLLPDANGKAGMVELRTAGAQQTLATPFAAADVTNRGNIIARVADGQAVQQPRGPMAWGPTRCRPALPPR